jgi:hypothetical protein
MNVLSGWICIEIIFSMVILLEGKSLVFLQWKKMIVGKMYRNAFFKQLAPTHT